MDNFDLKKYLTENRLLTEKSINSRTSEYVEFWELDDLKDRLTQLYQEMEQEAEPEGGPIADEYGAEIEAVEAAIDIKKGTFGKEPIPYDVAVGKMTRDEFEKSTKFNRNKKAKSSFWDESNLNLFEAQIFKVDWENFTDDEKETALLSVIKDPDDPRIDEFLFSEWDDLPDWVQDQMQIDRDDERADYTEDDWENFYLDADLPEGINEADIDKIASEWTVPELEDELLDLEIRKEEGEDVDVEIKKYEEAVKRLKAIKKFKGSPADLKTQVNVDSGEDEKELSNAERIRRAGKKDDEDEEDKKKKKKRIGGEKKVKKEKEKVKETMDTFDLKKFLSEGNLLKENTPDNQLADRILSDAMKALADDDYFDPDYPGGDIAANGSPYLQFHTEEQAEEAWHILIDYGLDGVLVGDMINLTKAMIPYLDEDKSLNEITQSGQEGVYPLSVKPGDMFQQKEVEELFPIAFATKDDKAFQDKLKQHGEWTEESGYNNTFVHFQYHKMKDVNGNDYFVHQSQHYNGNYDDFRNPKFTELFIIKNYETPDEEKLGRYIVGTGEYLDDIKNLEAGGVDMKRSMEEGKQKLNEDRYIVMWRQKDPEWLKKKGFDPEYHAFAPEAVKKGGWAKGKEFMVTYGDYETPKDRARAHAAKLEKEDGERVEYGVHLQRDNTRFEENVNEIVSNPSKIDIIIDNISKSSASEIKQMGQDVFGIAPQDFGEDADEIYSHIVDEILPMADDEEIDEYFEQYFGEYADEIWADYK